MIMRLPCVNKIRIIMTIIMKIIFIMIIILIMIKALMIIKIVITIITIKIFIFIIIIIIVIIIIITISITIIYLFDFEFSDSFCYRPMRIFLMSERRILQRAEWRSMLHMSTRLYRGLLRTRYSQSRTVWLKQRAPAPPPLPSAPAAFILSHSEPSRFSHKFSS